MGMYDISQTAVFVVPLVILLLAAFAFEKTIQRRFKLSKLLRSNLLTTAEKTRMDKEMHDTTHDLFILAVVVFVMTGVIWYSVADLYI